MGKEGEAKLLTSGAGQRTPNFTVPYNRLWLGSFAEKEKWGNFTRFVRFPLSSLPICDNIIFEDLFLRGQKLIK